MHLLEIWGKGQEWRVTGLQVWVRALSQGPFPRLVTWEPSSASRSDPVLFLCLSSRLQPRVHEGSQPMLYPPVIWRGFKIFQYLGPTPI